MALPILQSLSRPYKAVLNATASGMSAPSRSVTTGVVTAEIDAVTLFDNNGNALGVTGNALVVTGGTSGAGYAATPKGYQQLTSITSSTGLTVPSGATYCVVVVEANGVRYRDDGTAPTASVGMPLAVGQSVSFYGTTELAAVKFIQQASGAILNVSYYA